MRELVGRVGFEPTASRLKGEYTSLGVTDPKLGSPPGDRTLLIFFVGEVPSPDDKRAVWSTAFGDRYRTG